MGRFCGDCGAPADADDNWCNECGSKLDPVEPAAPVVAASPVVAAEKPMCSSCGQTIESGEVIDDGSKRYHAKCHASGENKCAGCQLPIGSGGFLQALGSNWHTQCLACCECKTVLGGAGQQSFTVREGRPLCIECAKKAQEAARAERLAKAPQCKGCDKPILDRFITVLDQTYHSDCFCCGQCGKPMGGGQIAQYNEKFFHAGECVDAAKKTFVGQQEAENRKVVQEFGDCAGCNRKIEKQCIEAMNKSWHPDCFKCATCGTAFGLSEGQIALVDNAPNCLSCAKRLQQEWEEKQKQLLQQTRELQLQEKQAAVQTGGSGGSKACSKCGSDVSGLAFCEDCGQKVA